MVELFKVLAMPFTAVIGCITALVILLVAVRSKSRVTRKADGTIQVDPSSRNVGCPAIIDTLLIKAKQRSIIYKIDYCQHVERPRDILRVCDDVFDSVHEYFLNNFRHYIEKELNEPDGGNHPGYVHLDRCMADIKETVMRECRRMVHENNFLLKEKNGEKDKYIDYQIQVLFNLIPARLNDIYRGVTPTREQLKIWARTNLDISWIMEQIKKAVAFCFVASHTYQARVDELEAELEHIERELTARYREGCKR